MTLYPLLMAPHFRSGEETPWGGSMLRDAFMKEAPDQTGESLEISALPERESMVRNGAHAGKSLSRMIELWGEQLTGLPAGSDFPLLLKLIDAKDTLSVQVHPDDAYAGANEGGKLGKTEAWIVLNCDEGARLAYGVDTHGKPLQEVVDGGAAEIEAALNWVDVRPGDVYYIPSGMVHAIGAGIVLYEIQQSSDVTYRFWDWNKPGADGRPRPLHWDKACRCARPELSLSPLRGQSRLQTDYFTLEKIKAVGGSAALPDRKGFRYVTLLSGAGALRHGTGSLPVRAGDTFFIPAGIEALTLEGTCEAAIASE